MKRITVEQVVKAFEQTGLTPKQGDYFEIDGEKVTCACGMGAVYAVENNIESIKPNSIDALKINHYFAKRYGGDYRFGFARGFDDLSSFSKEVANEKEFLAGYEDGVAARKAVLKEESK